MLVLRDGHTLGTLGGGCVEAEVRLRAQRMMSEPQARLLRFDLNQDYGWDDGLVCGGTMDIAVQIIASAADACFAQQIIDDVAADRMGVYTVEPTDENEQRSQFELRIPPTPKLVIAGAGHVAAALAGIAAGIDFRVTVIDDRADYAVSDRFPNATCVVGEIDAELRRLVVDPFTYITIVTRGHRHDAQSLAAVVNSSAAYIGLIGSKRKISTIFKSLAASGVSTDKLARVHAPIGFEIGAVTPAEIAVSIAAELISRRRGIGDRAVVPMKMSDEQLSRLLRTH